MLEYEEGVEVALYMVTLLVEGEGTLDQNSGVSDDEDEGRTLPLSIVIGGNARSTETLSFASSDVLQEDYEKTLNGMELFTFLFKSEDVGTVDNVEIGLDWSTRSSTKTIISLKSLQVTKQGGPESSLVIDDSTMDRISSSKDAEVSSFVCNKEISDRVGRRARFFDNLGDVPVESLIWGKTEDFVRVIDNIQRKSSTTANLDQIIVGLPQHQQKRESPRLALDIEALKELGKGKSGTVGEESNPEGKPQKRVSTIKKFARRLSIKGRARVSLDVQLGVEARALGFNPRASISISNTEVNDSHIDQDRLSFGLKRIFEDCSEKNGIKEGILGCLCGVNTLLVFDKREEDETKAAIEFLSLLIKSKEETDSSEQREEESIGKLYFQTERSQVRLMDISHFDELKSLPWFEGKYNNKFVVRKFLKKRETVSKPEPESTGKEKQKVRRKKASRQSLVNVAFSILGGVLNENDLRKVQQDSKKFVSFPGTLDDFLKAFMEWIESYALVNVEEQEGFLHSNIGCDISDEREDRIMGMTKIIAYSCGKVEADISDAYVAISSSSAYLGKDFFGKVNPQAYFEAQQDRIMSWLLSYHFFLEENVDKQLYPVANILANSSWFQTQVSDLEKRLEKQTNLLHTLSYSTEAIADPHSHKPVENARYYAYGDKVRSLLIDALTGNTNFETTSEDILSNIHVYLLNPRDQQQGAIGSIKEFKPQECVVSMGKDGTERKAGMKEIGILGLYVSDYEEHQNKFIQIGDSLIENLDAISTLKGFKVADLTSLQSFRKHLWIDWPSFANKMQVLFEQALRDCRKILQSSFEKWIVLRLQNLYNVEVGFLKVRWNPMIQFFDQVKELETLVKGLDTIINVDIKSTSVVLEALEDLAVVVSKHESVKKLEPQVSKSIQDTKEFLHNLQKLKEGL